MKICAIDSSGLVAGVAVSENGICVAEYDIQYKVTHSQTLLPMLDEVCRRISLDLRDVDAYAVAAGPGSFTGLRIGIATVKGLTLVNDKPVVAIPTLEALAYNAYGTDRLICPIMDARREQVYTGIYSFDRFSHNITGHVSEAADSISTDGAAGVTWDNCVGSSLRDRTSGMTEDNYAGSSESVLRCILPQTAMSFEELCSRLNEFGKPVMFIGDGIPVFADSMSGLLKIEYENAPLHMNRQRAGSLAALADYYMRTAPEIIAETGLEGVITDGLHLTPVYLRESQAERERKKSESDKDEGIVPSGAADGNGQ